MVLDFLDVMDRVSDGEKTTEREYDNLVFRESSKIVKEYGLKCDPETPVPDDDQLADELFDAALRLAVDVGGWCYSTKRAIKITEDEIKESLREIRKEVVVGEGRQTTKIVARKPEDSLRIFFYGGTFAPFTEDVARVIVRAMALLPIDGIAPFNIFEICGRRIADMPLEAWANRREIDWTREGITRAGKPGLHVLNYPISTKSSTIIGVLNTKYVRKTDGVMTSPLPELFKIDYDTLTANIVAREYGCLVDSNVGSMAGGYAGGYEGAAIVGLAGSLLCQTILSPDIMQLDAGINMLNPDLWTAPETRWVNNLCTQALARNTFVKSFPGAATSSEPGTLQCLMEIAYTVIGLVVSGGCATFSSRPMRPRRPNLPTPLEAKWGLEIADAALGMSRRDANEFIKQIEVPRERLEVQAKGKGFEESYDLAKLTPRKEYLEIYETAKKQLSDLGLSFGSTRTESEL